MTTQPRIVLARANRDSVSQLVSIALVDIHDPNDFFYYETENAETLSDNDPHELWVKDDLVGITSPLGVAQYDLEKFFNKQNTLVIGQTPSDLTAVLEMIEENEYDTIDLGHMQFTLDQKMPQNETDSSNVLEQLVEIQMMVKPAQKESA